MRKRKTEVSALPEVDADENGGVALAEGEERVELSALRENPDNPQTVTEDEFGKLRDSMRRIHGFLRTRPLLVEEDGTIKCGNKRFRALVRNGVRVVPADYVRRLSDYTPEEVREFILQDNLQRGDWDVDKLLAQYSADELKALGGGFDELIAEFAAKGAESEFEYSSKIEAPQYNITGDNPELEELYDTEKADALAKEIDEADVPKKVKAFLKVAAMRHVVFNFRNIAEYYAHADAKVQRLMEKSALVIIDFEDAIRNGFVVVSERMEALRRGDESEGGDDAE
jgi:ParB-like chromosome segregation protein Spo0J